MADDLLVTDAVIEDPLVLRRLLSDIIERLSNETTEKQAETITRIIDSSGIVDVGDKVTLTGDITGEGAFTASGSVAIDTTFDSIGNNALSEFCPGYTPVYLSATQFKIAALNVSNLYSVGRRVKFLAGSVAVYGTIIGVAFSTDTTVTMAMDAAVPIPTGITEACFVTGTAGWSPIPAGNHPFTGAINAIAAGTLSSILTWVAVGANGKLASSTNKGLNWTSRVSGTIETLNDVAYDKFNGRFMVVGNNGTILLSSDGITWAAVAAKPIYSSPPDLFGDIVSVAYGDNFVGNQWYILATGFVSGKFAVWGSIGSPTITGWTKGDISSEKGLFLRYIAGSTTGLASFTNGPFSVDGINTGSSGVIFTSALSAAVHLPRLGVVVGSNGSISETSNFTLGIGGGWFSQSLVNRSFGSTDILGVTIGKFISTRVAVGKMGKLASSGLLAGSVWTQRQNGFSPTSEILCVHYDELDAIFIAASNNGEICRSTNGIN